MNERAIQRAAIIGCDPPALELIRRGVALGQWTIPHAIDVPAQQQAALREIAPEIAFDAEWESIVDGESVDAILFAEPEGRFLDLPERRAEQLKKAAAAGLKLGLFHPACDGLLGYELEMARSTARGRIVSICPELAHPAIRHLAGAIQSGKLQKIEQVIVDRAGMATDRTAAVRQFAKDATLLRELFGVAAKLSANGPAPESDDWSNLAVLLTMPEGGPNIRWNLDPAATFSGMRMTIIASSGRAQLLLDAEGKTGSFATGDQVQTEEADSSWADDVWKKLAEPSGEQDGQEDAAWLGACRDLDLATALERSIARGRAIELKVDRATETANFKGVMSAWGCLLLLGALLFFVIWSVVGALELTWTHGADDATATAASDPTKVRLASNLSWRYLPMFLLAVALLGFLALQLLQVIIKQETKKAPEENPPTPNGA